jgi:hypothetical protein
VETRLIIAYSLIAVLMISLVVALFVAWRKRDRNRARDAGRGPHSGRNP